jgi:hypothetical protein
VTLWVKAKAQNGLSAELVTGRVGEQLGVAPGASVVLVPRAALASDGTSNHLEGLNVGTFEIVGSVNGRHLADLNPNFDAALLDPESWAKASVFQTFVESGDTQVLIEVSNGRIWSIDHGDALSSAYLSQPPATVSLTQRDVEIMNQRVDMVAQGPAALEMVEQIEGLSDDDLLEAVVGIPEGGSWGSSEETRFNLWQALKTNRSLIRQVIEQWTQ